MAMPPLVCTRASARRDSRTRWHVHCSTAGVLRRLASFALFASTSLALVACTDAPDDALAEDPNAGLLRDFLDGKYDSAGHPLNAKILTGVELCGGSALTPNTGCEAALPDGAMQGELTANLRLRVIEHASRGDILTATIVDDSGVTIVREILTVRRLRNRASWIDLPLQLAGGTAARIVIEAAAGARVEIDYLEVFPKQFGLVVAPGFGVVGNDDRLTFEMPRSKRLESLTADDVDVLPRLNDLLQQRLATRTTTGFRTLVEVRVGDLLPDRADVVELRAKTTGDTVRTQLRRTPAPCNFEGDPAGTKVLVTGFQPFPANGWHENVSAVAVTAMEPARLRDAQVMRLVLPVEYDRAAASIADAVERCAPDAVISFGQGGGSIALEEVAYNLQDTGEIAGGVPDNRGIIRAATQIDPAAPATRDSLLPLPLIKQELEALGETPRYSRDPGRYICNNVMFANVGAMGPRNKVAGFIHLPYTMVFDDATRARFGAVVRAAVQATANSLR